MALTRCIPVGQLQRRTLLVYNDGWERPQTEAAWQAVAAGRPIAGAKKMLAIPLGSHTSLEVTFTPPAAGPVELTLIARKAGREFFRDTRRFLADNPEPTSEHS